MPWLPSSALTTTKILELHKALLESNGYRVLIAPDGLAGIALAGEHSVDAIVLDFNVRPRMEIRSPR